MTNSKSVSWLNGVAFGALVSSLLRLSTDLWEAGTFTAGVALMLLWVMMIIYLWISLSVVFKK